MTKNLYIFFTTDSYRRFLQFIHEAFIHFKNRCNCDWSLIQFNASIFGENKCFSSNYICSFKKWQRFPSMSQDTAFLFLRHINNCTENKRVYLSKPRQRPLLLFYFVKWYNTEMFCQSNWWYLPVFLSTGSCLESISHMKQTKYKNHQLFKRSLMKEHSLMCTR